MNSSVLIPPLSKHCRTIHSRPLLENGSYIKKEEDPATPPQTPSQGLGQTHNTLLGNMLAEPGYPARSPSTTPNGCGPQLDSMSDGALQSDSTSDGDSGHGDSIGMEEFANSSPRDLDFSVPELRLLQDHIQDQYQDHGDYLSSDMSMHMGDIVNAAIAQVNTVTPKTSLTPCPPTPCPPMKEEDSKSTKRKRADLNLDGMTTMAALAPPPLNSTSLFPPSFLGQIDSNNHINSPSDSCASTPTGSDAGSLISGPNLNSNKPAGQETSEEKQERIRRRNREHARKCRIRKRQAADNLAARVKHLEQEYSKLMKAFRLVYNSKALMDSLVVSEFGSKGSLIVERTNKLALVSDRADILSASASVL